MMRRRMTVSGMMRICWRMNLLQPPDPSSRLPSLIPRPGEVLRTLYWVNAAWCLCKDLFSDLFTTHYLSHLTRLHYSHSCSSWLCFPRNWEICCWWIKLSVSVVNIEKVSWNRLLSIETRQESRNLYYPHWIFLPWICNTLIYTESLPFWQNH